MSLPRFHVPEPIAPATAGAAIALPERVAHHATRVLRLRVGDRIVLFDGTGGEHRARLVRVDRQGAQAEIERHDPIEREAPVAVTLAQSVLATDAMDYAVRKAVELGVAHIVPVIAERSQRIGERERGAKRQQHWQAIAIAACEQCGRNRVPAVGSPLTLDDYLATIGERNVAIAAPNAPLSLAALCAESPPPHVLVGPEGGLTDAEVERATARGAKAVHLGPRVLRADTAALAALATIAAVAGDAR